ncbi:MAG: terminase large subunit domain-containing protein [Rhizobiaceae bacterium]
MTRLAGAGLTKKLLGRLEKQEIAILNLREWPVFAGLPQRPPLSNWRTWLLLGGRGAGKTRAGAEWIKAIVGRDRHFVGDAAGRVAIIGETYADARAVMIEGESGLLKLYPRSERPSWNPSRRQLAWPDGTIGQVYSASDPEGLRGSQFGVAWLDELAKWRYLEETWDMMQFCLRLGNAPRLMATTTPKPLPLLKRILADPATAVTRSGTKDNVANLAPGFLEYLTSRYGGTRLGRQELEGEIIEDSEDSLWQPIHISGIRTIAGSR